jgi:hypothetical protein
MALSCTTADSASDNCFPVLVPVNDIDPAPAIAPFSVEPVSAASQSASDFPTDSSASAVGNSPAVDVSATINIAPGAPVSASAAAFISSSCCEHIGQVCVLSPATLHCAFLAPVSPPCCFSQSDPFSFAHKPAAISLALTLEAPVSALGTYVATALPPNSTHAADVSTALIPALAHHSVTSTGDVLDGPLAISADADLNPDSTPAPVCATIKFSTEWLDGLDRTGPFIKTMTFKGITADAKSVFMREQTTGPFHHRDTARCAYSPLIPTADIGNFNSGNQGKFLCHIFATFSFVCQENNATSSRGPMLACCPVASDVVRFLLLLILYGIIFLFGCPNIRVLAALAMDCSYRRQMLTICQLVDDFDVRRRLFMSRCQLRKTVILPLCDSVQISTCTQRSPGTNTSTLTNRLPDSLPFHRQVPKLLTIWNLLCRTITKSRIDSCFFLNFSSIARGMFLLLATSIFSFPVISANLCDQMTISVARSHLAATSLPSGLMLFAGGVTPGTTSGAANRSCHG